MLRLLAAIPALGLLAASPGINSGIDAAYDVADDGTLVCIQDSGLPEGISFNPLYVWQYYCQRALKHAAC